MPALDVFKSFVTNPRKIPANIFWRFPKTVSDKPHIFVVGAPRSGTTLMQSILCVHPQITGLDEETGFFMLRDLFSLKLDEIDEDEVVKAQVSSKNIVEYFDAIASIVTKNDPATHFLEKTPQHVLQLDFITNFFPKAKIIHIVRDGRDCYCSAKGHQGVVQGQSVEKYASYWKRCIQARINCNSKNIIDVKYESFTTNPESETHRIMEFIGLNFIAHQLDPLFYSKNKMSQKSEFMKLNSQITASSNMRWLTGMTEDEKKLFLSIAIEELSVFNYLRRE